MGLRDKLNENSRLTITIVGLVAVLASGFVATQVLSGRRTALGKLPDSYFSNDDGKTFFSAASENVAPFDRDGKTSVRAHIFQCCDKRYVGYLERYNTDAHQLKLSGKGTNETEMYGREVKKPGDAKWVKAHDLAVSGKVIDVRCPHGANAAPEPVEP
jgi:hypothetical protein